ncbi:Bug family tripartite tricarboxylate transporter substrate binding protein [Bordetella genomosp. 13]|uniref:ABC transporter substrate-binding protein n=1 Tax=Bordetella genomosp. 13 TaxID=463040 RepID=A0A1W6ZFS7_9BORD|nr:tripartite tricarboxylate transporter substrate-binding protein [Bordetella genomosp. 13]ARP96122.1 hypothetical protein CAL15_18120 [Bordetella genomosp. 13]
MLTKTLIRLFCSSALTAMAASAALAQGAKPTATFPVKQVEITVPYAVGGGVDMLGRLIGDQIGKLGQPVIVSNRGGAGGMVGTKYVAGQPKDGHFLLMTNDAYSLAPAIFKELSYDPKKDLEPVVAVAYAPMLVLVPTNSRFQTFADIVQASKGGKLSWASCGAGTDPHLAGEMMNMEYKMQNTHIPYKGCGPAMVDVMGGQVDYGVITISGALAHIAAGKLRPLAITSQQRSSATPNTPTMRELGATSFVLDQWQGFFVPAGTPETVKQDIYKTVSSIMKTPEMRQKLESLGYIIADEGPDSFKKIVHGDIDRFSALAKQIGLKAD